MDRFIDFVYDIDKDVEKALKSNMDRFIGFIQLISKQREKL